MNIPEGTLVVINAPDATAVHGRTGTVVGYVPREELSYRVAMHIYGGKVSHFYPHEVTVVEDHNLVLVETRKTLTDKLQKARKEQEKAADQVRRLESQIGELSTVLDLLS